MRFFKKLKVFLLRLGKPGWLIFKCLQLIKIGVKMIVDGRYRWETIYKNRPTSHHHQIYTYTSNDWYPVLFSECAKYFLNTQNNPAPKILSLGCSTGEEVFSLAKYMPLATIIGVDINQWCIKQCIRKRENQNHFFYNKNSTEFANIKDLDAIFCMAVLHRSENRTSIDNAYPVYTLFPKLNLRLTFITKNLEQKVC